MENLVEQCCYTKGNRQLSNIDEQETLRKKNQELERELSEVRQKNAELERVRASASSDDLAVPISEFEETLRRLVQRTAMIVQAEKCVIMVRDRETEDLIARSPAWGMTEEDVKLYRVKQNQGIAGAVFLSCEPTIFHNAESDPRVVQEIFKKLKVRNGVTVPLLIEKRDDQNHIVDRITIGVLHCFNKRYGGEFIDEDVRLLERLSRNAAAVIANAQMFQEVYEEKQKLVHTLESITAGLILVNLHGRIGQMNAQARALFGVPDGIEPIGKPVEDLIKHEGCLEIFKKRMSDTPEEEPALKADGTVKPDEITVLDKDDLEFIFQMHAASVQDDQSKPIGTVFIFNDITDLRNVERMKTEFVSIVSHELRTPLTPMKGFVSMLIDDKEEDMFTVEERFEFYSIIDENVDRLGRLIDDLLNVSRIEKMGTAGIEMVYQQIDLRKSAEEVVGVQKGRTDKHTLTIDFEPEHILVETDVDKIQNILHNLISNAIKYSPEGGDVRIIGRIEPPSEQFPIGSVLLGVKDDGLGIPEADLLHLGEQFYRIQHKGRHKVGGTGIGLFLVKNLIAAHGGYMWPESEGPGKGSTFWFRIPTCQPKSDEKNGPE